MPLIRFSPLQKPPDTNTWGKRRALIISYYLKRIINCSINHKKGGTMKFRVCNSILIFCFCATIFSSCNRQTKLEGQWIGCEIRKPCVDWTLTIEGNQFHLIREDSSRWYDGSFQLNNNCALKKIDLQIDDAHAPSQNGKTILGIYQISSNSLTVVVGQPGKPARPLSLDDPEGAVVFNFDRTKIINKIENQLYSNWR